LSKSPGGEGFQKFDSTKYLKGAMRGEVKNLPKIKHSSSASEKRSWKKKECLKLEGGVSLFSAENNYYLRKKLVGINNSGWRTRIKRVFRKGGRLRRGKKVQKRPTR